MLAELLTGVLTALILLTASVTRPQRATCPAGWYLSHGVQTRENSPLGPRGTFTCQRPPEGLEKQAPQPSGRFVGRLWCHHGTRPIVRSPRYATCVVGQW